MNKRIGVYTLFRNYNYGSILQCYALQKILENMEASPYVIEIYDEGLSKRISRILHAIGLVIRSIFHPTIMHELFRYVKESKRSVNDLDLKSKDAFNEFINNHIQVTRVKKINLKSFAKCAENCGFITGSDQVWNVSSPYINPNGYLLFAPKNKRYSYSASFGADQCPNWNKRIVKRYLKGMRTVSVRENRAELIAREFGREDVIRHIDPVFLLTQEEWDIIKEDYEDSDYHFAMFLNEPNSVAIEHLKELVMKSSSKLLYGPYKFDTLDEIGGYYISFSPEQYISLISKADRVYTDSFHSVALSIIYEKQFYVYKRRYSHNSSQNDRIISLLELFGLLDRYIEYPTVHVDKDYHTKVIINNERIKAKQYLFEITQQLMGVE